MSLTGSHLCGGDCEDPCEDPDPVRVIPPDDVPRIERRDRYTVMVNGHPIRATEAQEAALRLLPAAGVRRFLAVMGYPTSPGVSP